MLLLSKTNLRIIMQVKYDKKMFIHLAGHLCHVHKCIFIPWVIIELMLCDP